MGTALALHKPRKRIFTGGNAMSGLITTKHLILYAHLIIYHFGFSVYLRCVSRALLSSKPVTFLDCIR